MLVLAIYYTDPVLGRQKLVIPKPSDAERDHYLWVGQHIRSVPEGFSVGVFGAIQVLPTKTYCRRDYLLDRNKIGAIRVEEDYIPCELWS